MFYTILYLYWNMRLDKVLKFVRCENEHPQMNLAQYF